MALLICAAAGWVHRYSLTCENYSRSDTRILNFAYWIPLIATGAIHFVDSDLLLYAGLAFFGWFAFFIVVFKFYMNCRYNELPWKAYLSEFVCYGAMDVFEKTIDLSHGVADNPIWVPVLKVWWSFSIKFFMPWILWHLVLIFDVGRLFGSQAEDQGY